MTDVLASLPSEERPRPTQFPSMSLTQPKRDPDSAQSPTLRAEIEFDPVSGRFEFTFSGPECRGLPPWCYELIALAYGADHLSVDLRSLQVADPEWVRDEIRAAFRGSGCDLRILMEESEAASRRSGGLAIVE